MLYSGRRRQVGAVPIYQKCIRIVNRMRESCPAEWQTAEVLGTHGGTGLCWGHTQTRITLVKSFKGKWLNCSRHPQRRWGVHSHDTHDPNYSQSRLSVRKEWERSRRTHTHTHTHTKITNIHRERNLFVLCYIYLSLICMFIEAHNHS